jgi:cellulose synthase/poly-beta-1,6-N-acetylglucosamine synthase-like glycosyltransferase
MGLLKKFIIRNPRLSQRLLEILPGFVSWNLILFPIWGAFIFPEVIAYYLFFFSLYWLYRSLSLAVRMLRAHFQIKAHECFPFMKELIKHSDWDKVRHIVVIPTFKEPGRTLVRTLESLAKQDFPAKKIIPVIAFEKI